MADLGIRFAKQRDVGACVALIEERRRWYQTFEPRFWKKASNSEALTAEWYARRFADEQKNVALVAEINNVVMGFLIASLSPVPPVYDPGGPTAMIHDFAVRAGQWEEVGLLPLERAKGPRTSAADTNNVTNGCETASHISRNIETCRTKSSGY